jgi:hypothetical protein
MSSKKFAVLEILSDNEDINIACDNNQDNKKKPRLKAVYICIRRSNRNHGLMKNVQDFLAKVSKLKCSVYKIQTTAN